MSEKTGVFTKSNLDTYLKELAKEYRKLGGKNMPAEIILIGGAAILSGYGFRDMTTDIDAIIHASSSIRDAIRLVGDRFNLPNGWLNADFMQTPSYSPKLAEYSVYYKTCSNCVTIRTIAAEYLIAMKLRSGRKYKNDLSDIVGILAEHDRRGTPLTKARIEKAVCDLYGSTECISPDIMAFLDDVLQSDSFDRLYDFISSQETLSRDLLLEFNQNYPGAANMQNADNIISHLREKDRGSLLRQLKSREYPVSDKNDI